MIVSFIVGEHVDVAEAIAEATHNTLASQPFGPQEWTNQRRKLSSIAHEAASKWFDEKGRIRLDLDAKTGELKPVRVGE